MDHLQRIAIKKPSTVYLSSTYDTDISVIPKKLATRGDGSRSLRIFRELDGNVAPQCAGRMVISGRIQDVCAEIDRLANTKE